MTAASLAAAGALQPATGVWVPVVIVIAGIAGAAFLGTLAVLLVPWLAETLSAYGQRIDGPAALPVADPCPCCPGNPAAHPDCTCREPCGWQQCPAADIDVPDFLKGDGR